MSETKSKAEECTQKQLEQIAQDRNEMNELRRFGFFNPIQLQLVT